MSDYHILEMSRAQDQVRVAFHVPVPAGATNSAGIAYRSAIVGYLGTIESEIPGLDTTAHGLDDGSIVEFVETVSFSANLSNTEKRTAIEQAYTDRKTGLLTALQSILEFWGWEGDVS